MKEIYLEEFEFDAVDYTYPVSGIDTKIFKGVVKLDESVWYYFDMQLIRREDLPCEIKTIIAHSSSWVLAEYLL